MHRIGNKERCLWLSFLLCEIKDRLVTLDIINVERYYCFYDKDLSL